MPEGSREIARADPASPAAQMLSLIAKAASDPAVDVAKMQALLAMQKELIAEEARAAFNAAFARLAARLPRVRKSGEVSYPANKNNPEGPQKKAFAYARWEDIDAAIRPLLLDEGFSLSFDTAPHPGGGAIVTGALLHAAGHEKCASIGPLPLDTSGGKNNLQGAGSTFSYGKRYTATMLLNLTFEGEDDDGRRGGAEFISAEEVKRLSDLLIETKSDLDRFLQFMGVAGLPNIEKRDYPRAVNALVSKKSKVPS
ncbi:MAG TPA: ERF family protein [Stellaceae bacterium]|nr:ERF family protein [Stellaceae bacterium]